MMISVTAPGTLRGLTLIAGGTLSGKMVQSGKKKKAMIATDSEPAEANPMLVSNIIDLFYRKRPCLGAPKILAKLDDLVHSSPPVS